MPHFKTALLSTVFFIAISFTAPQPARADSVSLLPKTVQLNLRTAAQQGSAQLNSAVYHAVQQYPSAAQSIVNEAARLKSGMGQQLAETANKALSDSNRLARSSETRNATQRAAKKAGDGGIKTTSLSTPATATAPISTAGWVVAGLALGGGAAVAAVGAGGGNGDSSSGPSPAVAEYLANYGLSSINAASAYSGGATGTGITVAVADSGIDTDHVDLLGRWSGGYNAFTATTGPGVIEDDDAAISHGTFVSGIIAASKNSSGMHGVAYNATILPVKIFDSLGNSASVLQTAAAVDYASAQGVKVWNGSYGYDTPPSIFAIAPELDAYANAMDNGMVMVFSTGNDSLANPFVPAAMPYIAPVNDSSGLYTFNVGAADYSAYADRLLAVASVDANGTLSAFSNRCGVAAAWCLVAPGGSIYSTINTGGYRTGSGTSYAAPHVSGAVALLMEKYPSLTNAQVVSRILTTATKTGIYANSAIYGQGLLNLTSATSFVANAMLPVGNSLHGPVYQLSSSQLQLGSAFGDGLSKSLHSISFKPVDSFDGAAIETSGAKLVAASETSNSVVDGVRRFGRKGQTLKLDEMGDTTVNWQQLPATDKHEAQTEALATTRFSDGSAVSVGYMTDPALGFGLMAGDTTLASETRAEGALFSPYMGFAQGGMSFTAQTNVNGITLRAGSFSGHAENEENNKASGAAAEVMFSPYAGAQIGVQAGFVSEERSLLGTESAGALAIGQSHTSFAGVSAKLPVSSKIDVVGSYFTGTSSLDPAAGSLLTGFSDVRSDAFTIGAIHRDVASTGDRLGLMLNQPLRVSSGSASLNLPNGVDSNLNVAYMQTNAGLAPSGRELNVEAFYSTPLDAQSQLNASVMLRRQPDHVATASDEFQTIIRWQKKY